MSDALNYLVKARPETLGHYFAFLRDAGKLLDPKTRNLISVITKVHAQTERGFKQYLKRALREGCSAAEILDALLMAFPALGLTKIIWAVDIILTMDLPVFGQLALPPTTAMATEETIAVKPRWHDVASIASIQDKVVQRQNIEGVGMFIYRDGKSYAVFDSRCPHQGTTITELALDGTKLTCPKHKWEFDATSGSCIKQGNSPLTRVESKVVKGRLMALW